MLSSYHVPSVDSIEDRRKTARQTLQFGFGVERVCTKFLSAKGITDSKNLSLSDSRQISEHRLPPYYIG